MQIYPAKCLKIHGSSSIGEGHEQGSQGSKHTLILCAYQIKVNVYH